MAAESVSEETDMAEGGECSPEDNNTIIFSHAVEYNAYSTHV